MKNPGLKPFDYIITASALLLVIFFSVRIYSEQGGQAVLRIDAAGNEYLYSMDEDTELELDGPIGLTHVIISGGEAYISESPCEDKLCILMGSITKSGQWAACMPNRVFISIEGGADEAEIDVLSY